MDKITVLKQLNEMVDDSLDPNVAFCLKHGEIKALKYAIEAVKAYNPEQKTTSFDNMADEAEKESKKFYEAVYVPNNPEVVQDYSRRQITMTERITPDVQKLCRIAYLEGRLQSYKEYYSDDNKLSALQEPYI